MEKNNLTEELLCLIAQRLLKEAQLKRINCLLEFTEHHLGEVEDPKHSSCVHGQVASDTYQSSSGI